jgi:catechol 2,3-dioxygenase-like lactoylglutathione lyase family enzyme
MTHQSTAISRVQSPLPACKIVAFVGTSDPARAKSFYRDKLGLALLSEDPFAIVFDVNGIALRVSIVGKVAPAGYTVLGWAVPDIVAAAQYLQGAGIKLERYEGLPQDALGIWPAPGGTKVAWFKDPDGNTLSISEHPSPAK